MIYASALPVDTGGIDALPSALFPLKSGLTGEGVRTRPDGERPERRPRLVSHSGLMP